MTTFRVQPRRVLRGLLLITALLVVLSFIGDISRFFFGHGRLLGFIPEFNLDRENNIPTYFVSAMLLGAAVLLAVIAYAPAALSRRYRAYWLGLTAIFLFISVDEMASLHERLSEPMRETLSTDGLLYYGWVIPGIALLCVFAVAYFRFWTRLPERPRFLFALAGSTYVLGGLGVEVIGAQIDSTIGKSTFVYALAYTVEESLEMIGVALFIYALLTIISRHVAPMQVEVIGQRSKAT